jgi:hypothetical protein
MTRKRCEHAIHAEEVRLHKPSTRTILHRFAFKKNDFYRYARHVHAWLSAFAFLVLTFFAGTGLLLNNPNWFSTPSKDINLQITVPPSVLTQARTLENPAPILLDAVRTLVKPQTLSGAYKSSDLVDGEVDIRLIGAKGRTVMTIPLDTGLTNITVTPASRLDTLKNLHRGKKMGTLWKWVIDISAIVILILSFAGYALFFSLRKRKFISLWLTGLCLVTLVSAFIWGVV